MSEAVTKQDLLELKDELRAEIGEVRAEIGEVRAEMRAFAEAAEGRELRIAAEGQAHVDRVVEVMRDIETHLVGQFINWKQSSDEHFKKLDFSDANSATRLALLEKRVSDLELRNFKSN